MQRTDTGGRTILLSASTAQLTVLFEPGGGQFVLEPGESFRVLVHGPEEETMEVMHGPDYISVWPSPRLKVRIFDKSGSELEILGY